MPGCRTFALNDLSLRLDGLSLARNVDRRSFIPTRYMSDNETVAEAAWDQIEAGHGLVAIDPLWASAHNLPKTLIHPQDPTKVVYIIAAYHAIHCVVRQLKHTLSLYIT